MSDTNKSLRDKGKGKETAYETWLKQQGDFKKWKIEFPVDYNNVPYPYVAIVEDPRSAFNFFKRGYKTVEPYEETFEQKVERMQKYEAETPNLPNNYFVDASGIRVNSDKAELAVSTMAAQTVERYDGMTDELLDKFENPREGVDRNDTIRKLEHRINALKRQNSRCNDMFFKAYCKYITWEAPSENQNQTAYVRYE